MICLKKKLNKSQKEGIIAIKKLEYTNTRIFAIVSYFCFFI